MEKAKTFLAILGLGITIGVVLVVVLIFVVGARPQKVNVGGVEFEIPTPTPIAQVVPVTEVPAVVPSLLPASTSIPPIPTPNQCQWLQTNFPQSADDAKAKYNLPSGAKRKRWQSHGSAG